jgi:selenocysteine-specific elongation factor
VIVGTAGHIDHGKTSLVKALTGIDADRLKEEKARGITIDLGFAYKPLADGSVLGFVDVPGHERLVRNMLAGATGIDHVLLVVAADDGPMPQTREHLAILDLLGLSRGAVVLTKCDLVTPARLAEARPNHRPCCTTPAWPAHRVFAVSNTTGQGMADLEQHLLQAQREQGRPRRGLLSAWRWTAASAWPASAPWSPARRSPARSTWATACWSRRAGCRCACAACMRRTARPRKAWPASAWPEPGGHRASKRATSRAATGSSPSGAGQHTPHRRAHPALRSEARDLAHWTPVHLHLGACDVGARVVLLEGPTLAPGGSMRVQLELDRDIAAWHGDRFILRDQSATRTLGGGQVIDPFASATLRRKPQRLAALAAQELAAPEQALQALLALQQPAGLDIESPGGAQPAAAPSGRHCCRRAAPGLPDGSAQRCLRPASWKAWPIR